MSASTLHLQTKESLSASPRTREFSSKGLTATSRVLIQAECHVEEGLRYIKLRQAHRLNRWTARWGRTDTSDGECPVLDEVQAGEVVSLPDGRQPHLERSWGNLCIRMWNPNIHRLGHRGGRRL